MPRLRLKFPDQGQSAPHIDFTILIIGLLILIGVLFQFRYLAEEVNYWTNRVEHLEKQQQQKSTPRSRSSSRVREFSQEIRKEMNYANTVMDQINLPWEAMFDSVEFAATEEIALLSLQPNVANRTLRISGEARNMEELLTFVETLEREIIFKNVHLLNYRIRQDNPHRPIVFLLTATWTGIS